MKQMTSLEILKMVEEIQCLVGGSLENIYHDPERDTLRLKVSVPHKGISQLVLGSGFLYMTEKPVGENTPFAQQLRKHLRDQRILSIEQVRFDRVVKIKTASATLVCELFQKANFILLDANQHILTALEFHRWKDRAIIPKQLYQSPPSHDIRNKEEFHTLLHIDKKVVAILASAGFGRIAEDMLARAAIDKETTGNTLTETQHKKLFEAMHEILVQSVKPVLVKIDSEIIDALPYPSVYSDAQFEEKDTWSAALDQLYESGEVVELTRDERVALHQQKTFEEFTIKRANLEKTIEFIRAHYADVKEQLAQASKHKPFEFDAGFGAVAFRSNLNLEKNIGQLYDKIKALKKKEEHVERTLTKRALDETQTQHGRPFVKIQKQWFWKYRYFITSDGFLAVGGKDAQTNETLIKKHVTEYDLVFHAEIHGAPFVVLYAKKEKELTDTALEEAAQFAASYSKAWALGLGAVDVYWIKPQQVVKSAPTGQHLTTGSFVIEGKKNYYKQTQLGMAFGFIGGKPLLYPLKTAEKTTQKYVRIVPGETPAKTLWKKVLQLLEQKCTKEELKDLQNKGEELFVSRLPAGRGLVVSH
ncbi:MAG: NFACT family protein [Candidatus Aenigmarchaeota archaeon]|nr:NFACT family protein [Candidatus Aenigmarchaeota archaeon]